MVFKSNRAAKGYVLIEVVVSLVVFSIGAISVMRTFSTATQARGLTHDFTIAGFLCQKVMSESRAKGLAQEGPEQGDFGDEYPRFRWTRMVEIVMVELPPPPKQQGQPDARGRPWKRSRLSKRSRGQTKRAKEEERKPIPFLRTTAVVSWNRRGAGYNVSAETMLPLLDEQNKI
jgi:type II secretory pathway pseudopilin PulG